MTDPSPRMRPVDRGRIAIDAGIERLRERGTCWKDWAREHGFELQAVKDVVRGKGRCSRGERFRVAERLREIGRATVQISVCGEPSVAVRGALLEMARALLQRQLDGELEDLRDLAGSDGALACRAFDEKDAIRTAAELVDAIEGIDRALEGSKR